MMENLSHPDPHQSTEPQVQRVAWVGTTPSLPKSDSPNWTIHKGCFVSFSYPNPVVEHAQLVPPLPIISTALSPASQTHLKSITSSLLETASSDWYCKPYCTVQVPKDWLLAQTAQFLKSPSLVILERNASPPRPQTVTRGLQQRCVLWVVTARDLAPVYHPQCWRHHN